MAEPLVQIGTTTVTAWSLIQLVATLAATVLLALAAGRLFRSHLVERTPLEHSEAFALGRIFRVLILVYGAMAALACVGIDASRTVAQLGSVSLSPAGLATFLAWLALVFAGARITGRLVGTRWLSRAVANEGVRYAVGRLTQYVLIVVGVLLALQSSGFSLGAFAVIVGALSVGVGFGLQHIVNNFVSGLIVLLERPIEVGDWIDIDDTRGKVVQIGARSTTVVTRDNISIIVPNGDFISGKIVNWSHGDGRIRVHVPVDVAYGSDLERVTGVLLEVARANLDVLREPPPEVLFRAFGDFALKLELCAWVDVRTTRVPFTKSQLNFAIDAAFRRAKIEIPFPQHVEHVVADQPKVDIGIVSAP